MKTLPKGLVFSKTKS